MFASAACASLYVASHLYLQVKVRCTRPLLAMMWQATSSRDVLGRSWPGCTRPLLARMVFSFRSSAP